MNVESKSNVGGGGYTYKKINAYIMSFFKKKISPCLDAYETSALLSGFCVSVLWLKLSVVLKVLLDQSQSHSFNLPTERGITAAAWVVSFFLWYFSET